MSESRPIAELIAVSRIHRRGTVDVPALQGVDLRIEPGEFTALHGPSGAGKTTILALLGALDLPTSGVVRVEGRDLAELSARERSHLRRDRIGFVFHTCDLLPVLTVRENAELVLALQGVGEARRRERVTGLLAELGLAGLEDLRPDALSRAQQQHVALARAVAPRPAFVLVDEPTANLDSVAADRLLDRMDALNRERGATFVFATHDPRVSRRARRVLEIVDGRVARDSADATVGS